MWCAGHACLASRLCALIFSGCCLPPPVLVPSTSFPVYLRVYGCVLARASHVLMVSYILVLVNLPAVFPSPLVLWSKNNVEKKENAAVVLLCALSVRAPPYFDDVLMCSTRLIPFVHVNISRGGCTSTGVHPDIPPPLLKYGVPAFLAAEETSNSNADETHGVSRNIWHLEVSQMCNRFDFCTHRIIQRFSLRPFSFDFAEWKTNYS